MPPHTYFGVGDRDLGGGGRSWREMLFPEKEGGEIRAPMGAWDCRPPALRGSSCREEARGGLGTGK